MTYEDGTKRISSGTPPSELWLGDSFADSVYDMSAPMLAVVDTCFVRTGLKTQLSNGKAPPSLLAMQTGSVRAFMEGDTLREVFAHFPKFATQMSVPESKLRELFKTEWLPFIRIVELPGHLRELDERSLAVQQNDKDDYAAGSLAAVLSPCIIMTHDKDFEPLGFQNYGQAIVAIFLVDDVREGDAQLRAAVMIPTLPLIALGTGAKHAYDRYGPIALTFLALLVGAGVFAYSRQPDERKKLIRTGAGLVGRSLLEIYGETAAESRRIRHALARTLVPPAKDPHPFVSVLRTLATTPTSLSAQQLHDLLSPRYSFKVAELRAYLHENKSTLFFEERHGGFTLGLPYEVWCTRVKSSYDAL
jgi:hypothetical protein